MIARIQEVFAAQLAQQLCVQVHRHAAFFVHDPPPPASLPSQVVPGRVAKSDLHVRNSRQQDIVFIAVDKCLYGDADGERCDCALLINQQLYLVEFKTSATLRHANPGECLRQLAATVRAFYDLGIIQPGETVHAYASVGFSQQLPQNGAHWRAQNAELQLKIQADKKRPIRVRYCSESELDIS